MTAPTIERSTLTTVVSVLWRLREQYGETYERETAWDGGEFSGPAISASYERDVRAALAEHGWTAVELEAAIVERTSPRWAAFAGLLDDCCLTAQCDRCGTRQDVIESRDVNPRDPSTLLRLACGHVTL